MAALREERNIRGGLDKRIPETPYSDAPVSFTSIDAALGELASLFTALRRGEVETSRAKALASIAGVALGALRDHALEQRIAELEARTPNLRRAA